MSRTKTTQSRRPKSHRYALESRQMYDGAAPVETAHHGDTGAGHDIPAVRVGPTDDATRTPFDAAARENVDAAPERQADPSQVYVIDQSVQGWQSLAAQLPQGSTLIILDRGSSGLGQLAEALRGSQGITALHILSHGSGDSISLGTDTLTANNAGTFAEQLGTIGASLTADGDILLYGCDVATQDHALMSQLADLTHADVAASSDDTGAAALGGNWTLETSVGVVEAHALALDYDGLLAAPTVENSHTNGITVIEPSVLNKGYVDHGDHRDSTAILSGWTITDDGLPLVDDGLGNMIPSHPDVTVTAVVHDPAKGTLSSPGAYTTTPITDGFSFTGSVANAEAWLNQLVFSAADVELGKTSAKTTIDVTVDDGETSPVSHSLDVTVTPSNDPATISDQTVNAIEVDTPAIPDYRVGTTTIHIAVQDPEVDLASGASQSSRQIVYTVVSRPENGYLLLDGHYLGVGSVFTQEDVDADKLEYVHFITTGEHQNDADGFDVKVNDGATPLGDSAAAHITVDITPVNQAPSVSGFAAVYEGQPQNAQGTGNVGQYIVTGDGGDPGDSLTLYVTSLPAHGKLYYDGVELTTAMVGTGYAIANRNLLTYENDGIEGNGTDGFGVRATDSGGDSATATIDLTVRPVDDDPVWDGDSKLTAEVTAAGEVIVEDGELHPYLVTLTPDMLHATDPDSPTKNISFIVDWTATGHRGFLLLNGQQLADGNIFTMADVAAGHVHYVQRAGPIDGDIDQFTFQVVDNAASLHWKADGSTFTRLGGIYDGPAEGDVLSEFTFIVQLVHTEEGNGETWTAAPSIGVVDADSSHAGTNPDGGVDAARGSLPEGGTIVLGGNPADFGTAPGLSYVATDSSTGLQVDPAQVVYTFLGLDDSDGGGNGAAGSLQKLVGGDWVEIGNYGTFTQADINNGLIRFQHNGDSENFHVVASFQVTAGVLTLNTEGDLEQNFWNPTFDFFITPVNDAPTASGGHGTLVAENGTVYITTGQGGLLGFGDADDANSEDLLEGSKTIVDANGDTVDNAAYNHAASGDGALKFVVEDLPTGGTLEYFRGGDRSDNDNWVAVGEDQALDVSLLTNSDGTTGLRFVSDGSEVRETSFKVHALDRGGAMSASVTVAIFITNVNDTPQIASNPTVVPDPSDTDPNKIGPVGNPAAPPANEPLTVIEEGGYSQIDSTMLQGYDPDSTSEQVQYRITTAPLHGRVAYSGDGGHTFSTIGVGSSFSQEDVAEGRIWYINDGTEPSGNIYDAAPDDTFGFTISDGNLEQTGKEFWVYTLPTNDAPAVTGPSGPIAIDSDAAHAGLNLIKDAGGHTFSVADVDLPVTVTGTLLEDFIQVTVRLLQNGTALDIGDYGNVRIGYDVGSGVTVLDDFTGNHQLLTIQGRRAQVNAALAGLTVTFEDDGDAAHDEDAIYQVQVIADDRLRDDQGGLETGANGGVKNQSSTPPGAPTDISNELASPSVWYTEAVPLKGDIRGLDGNIVAKSVTIWASSINDTPTFGVDDLTKDVYEDQATFIGGDFHVVDAESAAFGTSVKVTLSVGSGTLSVGSGSGVTASGNGTGTLVLTGLASDIEALLNNATQGLKYTSAANVNHDTNGGGAAGDVTLTVSFDDAGDSRIGGDTDGSGSPANNPADVYVALTITPVNDAPVVNAGTGTVFLSGTTAVPGFSIGDVDDTDGGTLADTDGEEDFVQVIVRITDDSGVALGATDYGTGDIHIGSSNSGSSGASVGDFDGDFDGNNSALVIRGTLAEVNDYLSGLTVSIGGDRANADAAYRVEVIADDRVRSNEDGTPIGANGGLNNNAGGGTQAVLPTEIAPYAAIPGGLGANVAVNYIKVFPTAVNDPAHITVADKTVNEGSSTLLLPPIAVSDQDAGGDTLHVTVTLPTGFTYSAVGGSGGTIVSGVGSATFEMTGTLAQINSRLAALTVNLPDVPGDAAASDWNGAFKVTVMVSDQGNHGLRPGDLVADVGDSDDATSNPGDFDYVDATAALQTTRTFTVTVSPANDAPVVTGTTETLDAIYEDTGSSTPTSTPTGTLGGATVDALFASHFQDNKDDIDNSGNGGTGGSSDETLYGVAIRGLALNAAQGEWEYSTDGGTSWLAVGARSDSNALVLATDALLRFVPKANFHGTPASMTVRLIENNDNGDTGTGPAVPASGVTVDITGNGGSTRYSSGTVTLSTTVDNVNDRPTSVNTALEAIDEDNTASAGKTVAQLGFGYSDVTDDQSATGMNVAGGAKADTAFGGIAIVGNAESAGTNGHWQYDVGGGWQNIGVVSDSAALLLPTTAKLRFVPNADFNGDPGKLEVRVSDTSAGTVAFNASANISGSVDSVAGTEQWSAKKDLTTQVVKQNDAPVLGGSAASPTVNENGNTQIDPSVDPVRLFNNDIAPSDSDLSTTAGLGATMFGAGTITVKITNSYVPGDILFFDDTDGALPAGVTVSGGDASDLVITLDQDTTLADVKNIVEHIAYKSNSDNPTLNELSRAIAYSVRISDGNNAQAGGNDAGGPEALLSNAIVGSLTIESTSATNDKPTVDLNGSAGGIDYAAEWNEEANDTHVGKPIAPDAVLGDVDNVNFTQMTLEIDAVPDGHAETLTIGGTVFYLDATTGPVAVGDGDWLVTYNATTHTFTIVADGTVADKAGYQALLRDITYTNAKDDPSAVARTITVAVQDAGIKDDGDADPDNHLLPSDVATITLTVVPHNDQPRIENLQPSVSFKENEINAGSRTLLDASSSLAVIDADSLNFGGGSLTVSGLITGEDKVDLPGSAPGAPVLGDVYRSDNEVNYYNGATWDVVGSVTGGNGSDLVIEFYSAATPEVAVAIAHSLTFANTSHHPTSSRDLTITINDADGLGDPDGSLKEGKITVTIVRDNDAPTMSATTLGGTYIERGSELQFIGGTIAVGDPDGTPFWSAGSNGTLAVHLDDYLLGDTLTILDQGNNPGQIGVSGGTVKYGGNVIGTYSGGTGGADLVVTFTTADATPQAVEALLARLRFSSTSHDPTIDHASRGFTVVLDDGGNTKDSASATGALSVSMAGTIAITPMKDAPEITPAGSNAAYAENGPATLVDGTITVGDVDDTHIVHGTVTISGNRLDGDELAVTVGSTGITANYYASTGVLELDGNATAADYQAVLRTLTYRNSTDDPTDNTDKPTRTLTYSLTDANSDGVVDGDGDPDPGTGTATKTINITPAVDNPVLAGGDNGWTYIEQDDPAFVHGSIIVDSDADDTQMQSATVRITDWVEGDVLAVANAVLDGTGITATYTSSGVGAGTLTLAGNASLATYSDVLQAVTYASTSDNPTLYDAQLSRTVTWTVTDANSDLIPGPDGPGVSNTITTTINITAVNDAPVAKPDAGTVTEDGPSLSVGTINGVIRSGAAPGGTDTDADNVVGDLIVVGVVTGTETDLDTILDGAGNVAEVLQGAYGKLTLYADGHYTYALDNDNADVNALKNGNSLEDVFSYAISDGQTVVTGHESDYVTTLTITIDGHTDHAPEITDVNSGGDATGTDAVSEVGLTGDDDSDETGGAIEVSTLDGLKSITLSNAGGLQTLTLTADDLADLASLGAGAKTLDTGEGTLVVTGFTPTLSTDGLVVGGTLDYTYTLKAAQEHTATPGTSIDDVIDLKVTDRGDAEATGTLTVTIADDVPTAYDNAATVVEDATDPTVGGNVLTDANAATEVDRLGADDPTRVTKIDSVNKSTTSSLTDAMTDPDATTDLVGEYGTLTMNADGSYSYELDNANPFVNELKDGKTLTETYSYTIQDKDGDTSTATLTITIDGHTDHAPEITDVNSGGDATGTDAVSEVGLTGDDDSDETGGAIEVSTLDGLKSITLSNAGGLQTLTLTADDLADLASLGAGAKTLDTGEGTLVVTGFTPTLSTDGLVVGGTLDYTYTLKAAQEHTATPGTSIDDVIDLKVTDRGDAEATGTLTVTIADDVPTAYDNAATVVEDATDPTVGGNVLTDANAATEVDRLGADDPTRVTKIDSVNKSTTSSLTDAMTDPDATTDLVGEYGTLTMNADGSYSYELDNANPFVNELKDGKTLTETYSYTIQDKDGDTSTATLTITIDGHTDHAPEITDVNSGGDATGTDAVSEVGLTGDDDSDETGGAIEVSTLDGLKSITLSNAGGLQTLTLTADDLADLASLGAGAKTLDTGEGTLVVTGFTPTLSTDGLVVGGTLDYTYTLKAAQEHTATPGTSIDDVIDLKVTDRGDAEATGTLTVTIADDVPTAYDNAATVVEDATDPTVGGNVLTDANAATEVDRLGADDPTRVTKIDSVNKSTTSSLTDAMTDPDATTDLVGEYGTLTMNADGSYSYELDNANPFVNELKDGKTLTETYSYTIQDKDGDTSTATLTITIDGHTDHAPEITDVNSGGDATGTDAVSEVGLTGDDDSDETGGAIEVSTLDGLKSITLSNAGGLQTLTLTADDLADLASLGAGAKTLDTGEGTLVVTGFTPTLSTDGLVVGGTLDYTYTLKAAQEHTATPGTSIDDVIDLKVTDRGDAEATGTLTVTIADDVPTAYDNAATVVEDATDPTVGGNVLTDANAATEVDRLGADDPTRVTKIDSVNKSTTSSLTDAMTDPDATTDLVGEYGTLTMNADGSYSYELDNANPFVNELKDGKTLTETYSYTIQDKDGDTSTATLTITIDGHTDHAPEITDVNSGGDATGTDAVSEVGLTGDDDSDETGGAIEVSTLDGLKSITLSNAGGLQTLTLTADDLADLASLGAGAKTLDTGEGTLVVTGFTPTLSTDGLVVGGTLDYTYTLKAAQEHTATPGTSIDDVIDLKVTDRGDAEATGTLTVTIADDVPTAYDNAATVVEDATDPTVGGNVLTDANAATEVDRLGADDPTRVTKIDSVNKSTTSSLTDAMTDPDATTDLVGEYGTLTMNADGSYSYELDNANPFVNELKDGKTLTETYSYTIQDKDGDTSTATLTITIDGHTDHAPEITDVNSGGDATGTDAVSEVGLTGDDDSDETGGAIEVSTLDGLKSITLSNAGGLQTLTLTADDLADLASLGAGAKTLDTGEGTLVVTGFTPTLSTDGLVVGGTLDYTYTLKAAQEHTATPGTSIDDVIDLKVTDRGDAEATGTLTVTIADDVPTAYDNAATVVEDATDPTVGGNVLTDANAATEVDRLGADDPTRVTGLEFDDGAGGTTATWAGSGASATADLAGLFGTLTMKADGTYVYTVDNANTTVNALKDTDSLTETYSYTITDHDGDTSTATLTITITGHTDSAGLSITQNAASTVNEAGLVEAVDSETTTGTMKVIAADGLVSVTIDGTAYDVSDLVGFGTTPSADIDTGEGILTLTGFDVTDTVGGVPGGVPIEGTLHYSYTLKARLDHTGATATSIPDTIVLELLDAGAGTASGNLVIGIIDDAPSAAADANDITEDGAATVSGNVTGNDRIGADTTATPATAASLTGSYGSLTLQADGSYSYALDNANATVNALKSGDTLEDAFDYTITDADGDTSTATLTITIHGHTDGSPTVAPVDGNGAADGEATVHESGLVDRDGSQTTTGTIGLTAPDGLAKVTVGGTTVSLAQLGSLGTTPVAIDTGHGTLTLTGFTATATVGGVPTAGALSYSYTLDETATQPGTNSTETVALLVSDTHGGTTGNLVIEIVDDAPTALADTATIVEDGTAPVTGSVFDNDRIGADVTATPVTAVGFGGTSGTVGSGLSGSYGTLALNADGSYGYALDNANPAVNALQDGDTLTEVFDYTITDADGDTSTATLTVTIQGHGDGAPTVTPVDGNADTDGHATVRESGLVDHDGSQTTTGSIDLTAPNGLDSVTVGGTPVNLAQLADLAATPVVIDTPDGTLTLTGFTATANVGGIPTVGTLDYTYTLDGRLAHAGTDSTETIALLVSDTHGSTAGNLVIDIVDDVPTAANDTADITEDGATPVTGSVFGNDRIGADFTATPVTAVGFGGASGTVGSGLSGSYGTLTLQSDGSYGYALDNANTTVNALKDGDTLTEVFGYTITDADGDTSTATLTVTIHGHGDGAPSIVAVDGNGDSDGDATVHESGLVDASGDQMTDGTITVSSPEGVASVTIGGTTLTVAELAALTGGTPVTIDTGEGTLVLTGFDPTGDVGGVPTTGILQYHYTLKARQEHTGATADASVDTIALVVTDAGGGTAGNDLVIQIVDDVPTAAADTADITEDGATPVTGNVFTNDRIGADVTATPVTAVGFGGTSGTVGSGLSGSYGTLTLQSDGSYGYALDNANTTVNALKDGDTLTEVFGYTITDADGDTAMATLTITIDGHSDGVPSIVAVDGNGSITGHATVDEVGLRDGSGSERTGGSIDITAGDGMDSIVVGGRTVTLAELAGLGDHPIAIDTPAGHLVLTGFEAGGSVGGVPTGGRLTYTYAIDRPQDQPGGTDSTDNIALVVNETGGGRATGELVVAIRDDVPFARDDDAMIEQDAGQTTAAGNVFTGAGSTQDASDRIGVDGPASNGPVTGVVSANLGQAGQIGASSRGAFGSLVLNADGSYTYVLDTANPAVGSLAANQTLTDSFVYTITDSDGSTSQARLALTIGGVTPHMGTTPSTSAPGPVFTPEAPQGDRMFGGGYDYFGNDPNQGFTTSLFILPAIHEMHMDLVFGEEIHSSLLAIKQSATDTQYVLRNGIGTSRRLLNEMRSEQRVSFDNFRNGSRMLWDDFSPFSIKRFRSGGDGGDQLRLPPVSSTAIVVPGPAASPPRGAESLSARLAMIAQAGAAPRSHPRATTVQ